jgi:hypothetical protein
MLKNVWASKQISMKTKICIFNSYVKYLLLYGCKTCLLLRFRHSSTPASSIFTTSDGLTKYGMKICGDERYKSQCLNRICGGSGLDTSSENRKPAPHAKLRPETRKATGKEVGLATARGETLRQR